MKYSEAMEYIEKISQLGSVMGLSSIRELCKRLGNPQDQCRFVHIAGTNGKGSTLAYISSILTCAGYRTGRYSSPAVYDYRERFCIDGKMISKPAFAGYLERVARKADEMEAEGYAHPTVFEVETALAFLFFAEKKCDIVVLETGMGGETDATNVISSTLVSVFTSISMDHMQFLGKTLRDIANKKAGIMKPGNVVVSMKQQPEVMEVIMDKCADLGAQIRIADATKAHHIRYGFEKQKFSYGEYRDVEISLAGNFQIENAILALEVIGALNQLGYSVSEEQMRDGFCNTVWKGRFCALSKKPLFIVDGAHNEDAAMKLAQSVKQHFADRRKIFIMGILRDKEYVKIIEHTVPLADQIITTAAPGNARAMSSYDLAKEVREYQSNVTAADSIEEAVEMAYLFSDPKSVIIAFGSLSYLGRIIEIMEQKQKKF